MSYSWSKIDPSGVANSGRYAARAVLRYLTFPLLKCHLAESFTLPSYLEAGYIFSARVFLSHFLSLLLSAQPSILQRRVPVPTNDGGSTEDEEIFITTLPALNFLQLLVRTCQVGAGMPVTPSPNGGGAGMGKAAFQALVGKYERDLPWLKSPELKEVRATTLLVFLVLLKNPRSDAACVHQTRENIGEAYFGIRPANRGGNDMLSNLLGGLFGGGGGGGGAGRSHTPAITSPGLD
jgi:hypothetical protein